MLTWSSKRQLAFLLLVVGTIVIVSAYPIYRTFIYHEPSCFDDIRNQDEEGADCGGACQKVCSFRVTPLVVEWSRFFEVMPGNYDLAALVENRNFNAGIESIGYTFELYDNQSTMIGEKKGSVFVNPGEKFVIYEPNIRTGGRVPTRVFFDFEKEPSWIDGTTFKQPLSIKSRTLSGPYDPQPRLEASIFNDSIDLFSNVMVIAVVYDSARNAIAASQTVIESIGKEEEKEIFFTWPTPIINRPAVGSCTAPTDTMLVFDRSGSMESDGKNPPEPLTGAKTAAQEFAKKIGPADKLGLVSFATFASEPIDLALSGDQSLIQKSISSIAIGDNSEASGYTNLGDAMKKATIELSSERHDDKAKRAMVILTDGDSNRPKNPSNPNDLAYPENFAAEAAKEAKEAGISIYAIGLGNKVSEDYLKDKIASTPEYYHKAITTEALNQIYREIAQDVCKEETFTADIFIHFNTISESRR